MVVLRVARQQQCPLLQQTGCGQRGRLHANLFLKAIVDALVKEQGKHVGAKLRVVGVAAQDVGSLVEIGLA